MKKVVKMKVREQKVKDELKYVNRKELKNYKRWLENVDLKSVGFNID